MTNIYIYSHSDKLVRQKPDMEKPPSMQEIGFVNSKRKWSKHNDHLASLKQYPASFPESYDGKELVLDLDFRLQHQAQTVNDGWVDCSKELYDSIGSRRVIAVLIKPEEGKAYLQGKKAVGEDDSIKLKLFYWGNKTEEQVANAVIGVLSDGDSNILISPLEPTPSSSTEQQEAIPVAYWQKRCEAAENYLYALLNKCEMIFHDEIKKEVAEARSNWSNFIASLSSSALSSQVSKNVEEVKWQLCPKCSGQGNVCRPPGLPVEVTEWASSETSFVCDVCNGAKIIAPPKQ